MTMNEIKKKALTEAYQKRVAELYRSFLSAKIMRSEYEIRKLLDAVDEFYLTELEKLEEE